MEKRNLRKERVGIVTSNMMEKSIVVAEVKRVKHAMYGKFVLKTKNMSLTMTKMIAMLGIKLK